MKYFFNVNLFYVCMMFGMSIFTTPIKSAEPAQTSALDISIQIKTDDKTIAEFTQKLNELHTSLRCLIQNEANRYQALSKALYANLVDQLLLFFSLRELKQIKNLKDPILKLILASCDAIETFTRNLIQQYETNHSEQAAPVLNEASEQAASSLQQLKELIQKNVVCGYSSACSSQGRVELFWASIQPDFKNILNTYVPESQKQLANSLVQYDNRLATIFKEKIAQHLSENDINQLTAFVGTETYKKLIKHCNGIINAALRALSQETNMQARNLISEFHASLQNFMTKIVNCIRNK